MKDNLIERLRSYDPDPGKTAHEAAARIAELDARIAVLEGALREIATSARGGDPLARDRDADTLAAIARHADRAALTPPEQGDG